MRKLREDDEDNFNQELFRALIGPKQYPLVSVQIQIFAIKN